MAMAYSPVSPNLENSNQWQETVSGDDVDLEVFERYIQQIILKSDIGDVTRGEFVNPDTDPENWLDTLLTIDYDPNTDEFDTAAKNLSEELNSIIHTNSKDGVLFCVQATATGDSLTEDGRQDVVSLLKLDLVEEVRLQLGDDHSLTELDLNDIFPEPKELQKGLIYPILHSREFRLPGDVKFYQNGTVSNYFHDFLECEIVTSSLEQAKSIFSVIDEIKQERTGQTTNAEDVNRFRELRSNTDGELIGIDEVTDVASEIIGGGVSGEEIASRLGVENPRSLAIDTQEMPSYVKYEVDDEIEIKFPSSAEGQVEKENLEDGVRVSISGANVSTRIVDR